MVTATTAYQVAAGKFPFVKVLPNTIVGVALIALMGFSYFNARSLKQS